MYSGKSKKINKKIFLQGLVKETKSVASLSGPGDILTRTNNFLASIYHPVYSDVEES
jgi:hypothetical protein